MRYNKVQLCLKINNNKSKTEFLLEIVKNIKSIRPLLNKQEDSKTFTKIK